MELEVAEEGEEFKSHGESVLEKKQNRIIRAS
jgi:hypothetical protein